MENSYVLLISYFSLFFKVKYKMVIIKIKFISVIIKMEASVVYLNKFFNLVEIFNLILIEYEKIYLLF